MNTRGRGNLENYWIEQQLLVNHMENWPANSLDWSGVGSVWRRQRLVYLICGDKKCPHASRIQFTSARKMCGKCKDMTRRLAPVFLHFPTLFYQPAMLISSNSSSPCRLLRFAGHLDSDRIHKSHLQSSAKMQFNLRLGECGVCSISN